VVVRGRDLGEVTAREPAPDGVLAFDRRPAGGTAGGTVSCVANLPGGPVALPPHAAVLLASGPLDGGLLPSGTAVWLQR
jgi:alpha-glucosidase